MLQPKSFCVALPNWPRCQKLGETIFVSACGIQTIEANAVTADVCITLAVRSLTQRPLDLCRQPKHRQSFKKELERSRAPAKPTRVRHPLLREMLDRRARSRNGILSRSDDRTCCELLRSILPNSLVDHETGILSDCQGISQFAPLG